MKVCEGSHESYDSLSSKFVGQKWSEECLSAARDYHGGKEQPMWKWTIQFGKYSIFFLDM